MSPHRLGGFAMTCLLLLALGGGTASAVPVSADHSGWLWGDPTPQGDALADVAFIGTRCYAVGEEGTVLRSDDGGSTWQGLPSGTLNNLTRIQAVDPETVVVGGGCTLRESTDAGASFQPVAISGSGGKLCSSDRLVLVRQRDSRFR